MISPIDTASLNNSIVQLSALYRALRCHLAGAYVIHVEDKCEVNVAYGGNNFSRRLMTFGENDRHGRTMILKDYRPLIRTLSATMVSGSEQKTFLPFFFPNGTVFSFANRPSFFTDRTIDRAE